MFQPCETTIFFAGDMEAPSISTRPGAPAHLSTAAALEFADAAGPEAAATARGLGAAVEGPHDGRPRLRPHRGIA